MLDELNDNDLIDAIKADPASTERELELAYRLQQSFDEIQDIATVLTTLQKELS